MTTGGSQDDSIEAKVFGPGKITIDAGDTVRWHIGSKEPHTVSFGFDHPINPASPQATTPIPGSSFDGTKQVSSGLFATDYSLSFPKEGTYTYLCLIHPGHGRPGSGPAGGHGLSPDSGADLGAGRAADRRGCSPYGRPRACR